MYFRQVNAGSNDYDPYYFRVRRSLAAGVHSYKVQGRVSAGTITQNSGAGGAGVYRPSFIRVVLSTPLSTAPAGALLPVQYGTSLPTSPVDGQEAIIVDSLTDPTFQWRFRWNAGSSSPYKWEFVGGAPYVRYTWRASPLRPTPPLRNIGPSLALPRAGEYSLAYAAFTGGSDTNVTSRWLANGAEITAFVDVHTPGLGWGQRSSATRRCWR